MLIKTDLPQSQQIEIRELLGEKEPQNDILYPKFDSERLIIGEKIRDSTAQTETEQIIDIKSLMNDAKVLKADRDTIKFIQSNQWETVECIYHKNIEEKEYGLI